MNVPDPAWKNGPPEDEEYIDLDQLKWDYDPGPDTDPDQVWQAVHEYEKELER